MVVVTLDCKIEMPETDLATETHITQEIESRLKIVSKQLSEKAADILKERTRLKIFAQGA